MSIYKIMYIVKLFEVTYPYLKINGKRDINPKSITVLETVWIEINNLSYKIDVYEGLLDTIE